jgi:hypothetical protein
VFAAMLSADNKETKTNQLVIEDFEKDIVKQMITFLYTGKFKDNESLVRPELLLLVKHLISKF